MNVFNERIIVANNLSHFIFSRFIFSYFFLFQNPSTKSIIYGQTGKKQLIKWYI